MNKTKKLKYETITKYKLFDILDDLLIDCQNDLFENRDETTTEKEANIIYNNIDLFILKLKEKIEDET